MSQPGTLFVVSAHAADFVWRAGGAIALHSSQGWKVRVLCLSFGERGESARLWKDGKILEEIKAIRRAEAEQAAAILGADIRFFDVGDYPIDVTPELRDGLVQEIRAHRPDVILTHTFLDPYNADHPRTAELVREARILAQAHGYPSDYPPIGAPQLYSFEPHQPEQCQFRIDLLLDITSVFDKKLQAMECMQAQEHLWAYYTDVAKRRGVQAGRNSGQPIVYAEAYQRVFPSVGGAFV
ncbi:GlcNAc-PI de-N-acetylase [Alicyclobacillus tengchongensis]|nr:GlcNAc-PI de-N-acetylase [Alicyclobacillus tengchongensis]